jgi:hypothetical protein
VLCYILGDLIFGDNGDDPWMVCLIMLVVIVIIIVLIILLIALVVLGVLLLTLSGQIIGGLFARRGIRYGLSVALLTCGTIVSFLFGTIAALVAIGGEMDIWIRVALLLWGAYSVISSIVTGVCTFMVVGAKSTFVRHIPKGRRRSRRSK